MRTALLFILGLACACAIPAAGTKCGAGEAYCATAQTMRLCSDAGVLADTACGGPTGCVKKGTVWGPRPIVCDQGAGAVAGAFCSAEYEGTGECSADGAATLKCTSGTWVAVACLSGTKCSNGIGGVSCR